MRLRYTSADTAEAQKSLSRSQSLSVNPWEYSVKQKMSKF
jgi:hypothetical protein